MTRKWQNIALTVEQIRNTIVDTVAAEEEAEVSLNQSLLTKFFETLELLYDGVERCHK